MTIFDIVLCEDTHGLKDKLVLGVAVSKPSVKYIEGLDPSIECLVASSSPLFEVHYFGSI
jgi:hypothetical protein